MKDDPSIYRFTFRNKMPVADLKLNFLLAAFIAEFLFGKVRVRLEGPTFRLPHEKTCLIDGSTEVGRVIAKIFAGFMSQEFGSSSFHVERMDRIPGLTHQNKKGGLRG